MNRLRAFAEYAAIRAALASFHLAHAGGALGGLLYRAAVRARVCRENLARAFPEKCEAEREEVVRSLYRRYGRLLVESLDWPKWDAGEWRRRVSLEGKEHLRAASEAGRGVVLLVGHLAAYELGPARLAVDGLRLLSVYQPVHNPFVDRFVRRLRTLGGAEVADRRMGLRKVLRALREGGVVAILADEDAGPGGAFVPFFGHLASTHRGPVELARRTGAAIVSGHVVAEGDGTYRGVFEPPIPPGTDEEVLGEYHRRLEAMIRRYPDQYFWFHRRWKTPPPAPPPREKPPA